jgi:ATP-dependent DNA ligase
VAPHGLRWHRVVTKHEAHRLAVTSALQLVYASPNGLHDRKKRLERLMSGSEDPRLLYVEHVPAEHKRADSRYWSGETRDWLKIKPGRGARATSRSRERSTRKAQRLGKLRIGARNAAKLGFASGFRREGRSHAIARLATS